MTALGSTKANSPTAVPQNNGAVGSERGTFFDMRVSVFFFSFNQLERVENISEDHAGTTENAFFKYHVVINTGVILDLALIIHSDLIPHKHVLA